jgi:hypothetical protein
MRKWVIFAALFTVILGVPAYAEHRDLDLQDYDDDLMRDLDKTIKFFEPDIQAGNAQGAADDADVLRDGFKYTEDYFTKKGNAEDAVKISQQGLQSLAAAVKFTEQNNFEAAAVAARQVSGTCRTCHDIYKPLNKK